MYVACYQLVFLEKSLCIDVFNPNCLSNRMSTKCWEIKLDKDNTEETGCEQSRYIVTYKVNAVAT